MPARIRRTAGFTLVEMLVVLTILGLLGALVLIRGPLRSAGLEMRLASESIAETLRLARTRAMARNAETMIVFDTATASMQVDHGTFRPLPAGLSVAVVANAQAGAGARGGILFTPDGSSSGGRVELAGGGQRAAVVVNWLTGQVSVTPGS